MSDFLNFSLISEAIVLDLLCDFESISHEKTNDLLALKKLDLILTTVTSFADAFSEMFLEIYETCLFKDISENEFLAFIVTRSLILCGKKTYFNLMLVCGFISEIVYYLITRFDCFHFAKLTGRCLALIIKKEFGELLGAKSCCEDLLSYCKNIKQKVDLCCIEEARSGTNGLIKQFKSLNTDDSDMKCEESKLHVNSEDMGNLHSLEMEAQSRRMSKEGTDFELVNLTQTFSNLSNEDISSNWSQTGNFVMPNFLYELLTDSTEHLDEIITLINQCAAVDPNQISLTEFEFLLGYVREISAMVVQEECPNTDSSICLSSNLSGDSNSDGSKSSESAISHSECPTLMEIDAEVLEYCELCKGKEEQYMKNWKLELFERYPEFKNNIKNENI